MINEFKKRRNYKKYFETFPVKYRNIHGEIGHDHYRLCCICGNRIWIFPEIEPYIVRFPEAGLMAHKKCLDSIAQERYPLDEKCKDCGKQLEDYIVIGLAGRSYYCKPCNIVLHITYEWDEKHKKKKVVA